MNYYVQGQYLKYQKIEYRDFDNYTSYKIMKQKNQHNPEIRNTLYCNISLSNNIQLEIVDNRLVMLVGDDFYRGNDGKIRDMRGEWNQAYMGLLGESGDDLDRCWPLLRLDVRQREGWKSYQLKCRNCGDQYTKLIQITNQFNLSKLLSLYSSSTQQNNFTFPNLLKKLVKIFLRIQNTHNPNTRNLLIFTLPCKNCSDYSILLIPHQKKTQNQSLQYFSFDVLTKIYNLLSSRYKFDPKLKDLIYGSVSSERLYLQAIWNWFEKQEKSGKQLVDMSIQRNEKINDVDLNQIRKLKTSHILSHPHKKQLDENSKLVDYSIDLTSKHETKMSYYKVNNNRKFISERNNQPFYAQQFQFKKQDQNRSEKKVSNHKRSYRKLLTQESVHSKRKRWSIDFFATDTIKAQAKKENHKLLQKQKENKIKKEDNLIKKLKIRPMLQLEVDEKIRESQIPWSQISQLSKQIAKIHIETAKNQNYNLMAASEQQIRCQSQIKQYEKIKQIEFEPEVKQATKDKTECKKPKRKDGVKLSIKRKQLDPLAQQVWVRINKQILSKIDPIGEVVNETIQLSKKYGVNGLKPLFLIYKKFFYMRTAVLSSLTENTQPIFGDIKPSDWSKLCFDEIHKQKIKCMEQENQCILKSLLKMQKKIEQKDKNLVIQQSIWQIIIKQENIYSQFSEEMIRSNIQNFKQIHEKINNSRKNDINESNQDKKVIVRYGKGIMLAVLDDLEENQYQKVFTWSQKINEPGSMMQKLMQLGRVLK